MGAAQLGVDSGFCSSHSFKGVLAGVGGGAVVISLSHALSLANLLQAARFPRFPHSAGAEGKEPSSGGLHRLSHRAREGRLGGKMCTVSVTHVGPLLSTADTLRERDRGGDEI